MTPEEKELKDCPFCGSKNLRLSHETVYEFPAMVICNDCTCNGPLVGTNQFELAIELWNRRQPQDLVPSDEESLCSILDGWGVNKPIELAEVICSKFGQQRTDK